MKNPEEEICICKIDSFGTKSWFNKRGSRHRENNLTAVEYRNGSKYWYSFGFCYRYDQWITNEDEQ